VRILRVHQGRCTATLCFTAPRTSPLVGAMAVRCGLQALDRRQDRSPGLLITSLYTAGGIQQVVSGLQALLIVGSQQYKGRRYNNKVETVPGTKANTPSTSCRTEGGFPLLYLRSATTLLVTARRRLRNEIHASSSPPPPPPPFLLSILFSFFLSFL
jgi:hypothetical protein